MKESIITTVVGDGDAETYLEIRVDVKEDLLWIYLNNKEICCGGWSDNIHDVFVRALEIWKQTEDAE